MGALCMIVAEHRLIHREIPMSLRKRYLMALLAAFCLTSMTSTAWAQDEKKEEKSSEEKSDEKKEGEEKKDDEKKDDEEKKSDEKEEKKDDEEERKSEHGDYEFKRSYGGGLEFGLFFSPFERWNTSLLEPNNEAQFDTDVALNLDLAFEVTPIEGARFTLFGGMQGTGTNNPGLSALYFGLEPAFAFRRERWELAVGTGIGVGRLDLTLDSGAGARTGLVLARPFIEARTYAAKFAAIYARLGFNYWHVYGEELDGLDPTPDRPGGVDGATSNLNEGGLYLSIGTRFGHYPEPVKSIPDSDEDGLRDDIDDCPDEPEDMDEFKDDDGCPEPDNDEDTILDEADQCPLDKEDLDKFEDEDGCPDPDNDRDRIPDTKDECPDEPEDLDNFEDENGCPDPDNDNDNVLDKEDQCPVDPEDEDGFQDDDGCPDPDNDRDTILDTDDACPNEAGVPEEKGCPIKDRDKDTIPDRVDKCPDKPETFNGIKDDDGCPDGKETVVVTKTEIKILQKVFFDTGRATIKSKSYPLLNTVALVLIRNPQITKARVEGHTDDVGDEYDNLELSRRRAEAVRAYLVDQGVPPSRLEYEGYGEERPLCKEMDELLENQRKNRRKIKQCRSDNRRVEFRITEVNGNPVEPDDSVMIKKKKDTGEIRLD